MRPLMATDHVKEPRLRIRYIQKHAPYNSQEERTVNESIARRLCVLGVCVPAPERRDLVNSEGKPIKDRFGGWSLSADEIAAREGLDKARMEEAGDFRQEVADDKALRRDEELRVKEEAERKAKNNDKKKPSGFLRGKDPKKT